MHCRTSLCLEQGKAVFSSGSPFEKVDFNGKIYRPGQGNNAYIFPGLGLGAIMSTAQKIPDELFLVAAKTLSELVTKADLEEGALYPKLTEIRHLSLLIAIAVAEKAYELDITLEKKPENLNKIISDFVYNPKY